MTPENLLLTSLVILLLPLFSFTVNIFWGKRLGKASSYLGATVLGIDFILALCVFICKMFNNFETGIVKTAGGAIEIFSSNAVVHAKYQWLNFGIFGGMKVGIGVDNLTAMMLLVVTLISFLVHLFSMVYMAGDKRFSRFYAYLGIFTFSMLGIVLSNNFLCMYIFWELVGICSYMLIGFWYEKDSAANAGKKAFLTNRVGDFGFLIGIMLVYFVFGSFMFDEVFPAINSKATLAGISSGMIKLPFGVDYGTYLTMAGIFVFCGAIGKSAQFPLHIWLPDAMEGPTPVSALIHAATMVAAGVYLVARIFPMLTGDALAFVALIGSITAFMAATIAVTQRDFKKVLAYSTVSQLGYMVMALGVGAYTSGFMHLVTHAWFKAALFLAAGSVIHAMHLSMHHAGEHEMDPQDIYNMGGLRHNMKWTYVTFLIVTFALCGVPFTSGFLSKDSILAGTLAYAQITGGASWLIPVAGFGAAGLTAFYMFRLTIIAFHGKPKTEIAKHTKENEFRVVMPLVVLAALSLWIFYSPNPISANDGWFFDKIKQPQTAVPHQYQRPQLINFEMNKNDAYINPDIYNKNVPTAAQAVNATAKPEVHELQNDFAEAMHHAHYPAMILSLIIAGCGILLAFMIYQFGVFNPDNMEKQFKPLHDFTFHKWYIDELYNATIIGGSIVLSKALSWFDTNVVDGVVNLTAGVTRFSGVIAGYFDTYVVDGIVNLLAKITDVSGGILRKLQTGRVQSYVALAIAGLIILFFFFK